MKKAYYSILNSIIRQKKTDGQYLIDRVDIEKFIDLSEESREDVEDMCKKAMIGVMLYQNNYRSCVRGQGVFIDVDALKSKTIANMLIRNESLSAEQKLAAVQKLKSIADGLPDDRYSQIAFDMDGVLYEEMTKADLINLIHELQEQAVNE